MSDFSLQTTFHFCHLIYSLNNQPLKKLTLPGDPGPETLNGTSETAPPSKDGAAISCGFSFYYPC